MIPRSKRGNMIIANQHCKKLNIGLWMTKGWGFEQSDKVVMDCQNFNLIKPTGSMIQV